jgi:hypothetical protein
VFHRHFCSTVEHPFFLTQVLGGPHLWLFLSLSVHLVRNAYSIRSLERILQFPYHFFCFVSMKKFPFAPLHHNFLFMFYWSSSQALVASILGQAWIFAVRPFILYVLRPHFVVATSSLSNGVTASCAWVTWCIAETSAVLVSQDWWNFCLLSLRRTIYIAGVDSWLLVTAGKISVFHVCFNRDRWQLNTQLFWGSPLTGVGIARYSDWLRAGRSGFDSRQSRPALAPAQLLIKWVPGALSPGVKQQGREADHIHLVPMSRMVALYLYSPVYLHGVVRN